MMNSALHLLLLSLISTHTNAQFALAPRVNVQPKCGSQLITVDISFNKDLLPGGRFTDWIVFGVTGRPECRLKGNGETHYFIEIAVFNDPCQTMMPSPGVFENRVRIGQNPSVILASDETFKIRCVYGLPEVGTIPLPVINPNFAIDNGSPRTGSFGLPSSSNSEIKPINVQPTRVGTELTAEQLAALNRQLLENARGSNNNENPAVLANSNANLNAGIPSMFAGLLNSTQNQGERPNPNMPAGNKLIDFDSQNPNSVFVEQGNGIRDNLDIRPIKTNTEDQDPNTNSLQFGQSTENQQPISTASRISQILLFALIAFLILALLFLCCIYFCMRHRQSRNQQTQGLRVSTPQTSGIGRIGFGNLWWTGKATNQHSDYTGLDSTRHGSSASPAESGLSSQQAVLPKRHFEKNKRSFGAFDNNTNSFGRRSSTDNQSRADYLPTSSMSIPASNSNDIYSSTRRMNRAFIGDEENHYASGSFISASTRPPIESPPPAPMMKDYAATAQSSNFVEHYITETEHTSEQFNERAVDVAEVSKNVTRDRFEKVDQSIAELQKPKSYSEWRKTLLSNQLELPEKPSNSSSVQISSREVPAGFYPDEGISSFRSITEIYQSVGTKKAEEQTNFEAIEEELKRAVMPMRGFGPRKLNEQELGRWRSLIHKDVRFREMLQTCRNIGDVLSVTERAEYRNVFTREKWGEIARCVADSPVIKSNLRSQNSSSNLNVYVGSVGTDW